MEKDQFKFRPEPQLKGRLDDCAKRCGLPSAQQFVIAALDAYAELMAELIIEERDQVMLLRKRQREQLLSNANQGQESGVGRRK